MKKRLIQTLMTSLLLISLTASSVIPVMGQEDKYKITDITLQEDVTDYNNSLYAGIIATINFDMACVVYDYELSKQIGKFYAFYGWTTDRVNVRTKPDTNSEIIDVLDFNTKIQYSLCDDEWIRINYKGDDAFISNKYITDVECSFIKFDVPDNNGFKSFMSYKAITDKTSKQYNLQHNYAYTGNYGIRQINNRYCVAIGTAFNSEIGDYVDLVLENGEVIPCIIADIKANKHTESNNIVTSSNGCVSEFVIDINTLDKNIKKHGDVSAAKEEWDSKVVTIKIYDKNVLN